ncbi:MAG: peptidoglycan-binding protein LysM, partial [Clostridia bacterium]|nr:peptidoglycan-binding protein LysM [Clostridia bacterium]
MKLTAMRYKSYVWPYNPHTYTIDYERRMAVHGVPFGTYQ